MLEILQIKAMEDSTLKWILWAWAMGWSAIFKRKNVEPNVITRIGKYNLHCRTFNNSASGTLDLKDIDKDDYKITGYKYAGELAGSEAIPVGQRFLDQAGDILTFKAQLKNNVVRLENDKGIVYEYCKNEITPVFNI